MPATIQIKGLERLQGKLKTVEQLEPVKAALKAAGLHIKGKIAQYPPASEANQPGQKRWYERGYGPRWPGGGKPTSEMLGRKWTIGERNGGLTVIVGNNVSYGPFVQGEKQAHFHAKRGWKTTETVAKEEAKTVSEFIRKEIDKVLSE